MVIFLWVNIVIFTAALVHCIVIISYGETALCMDDEVKHTCSSLQKDW